MKEGTQLKKGDKLPSAPFGATKAKRNYKCMSLRDRSFMALSVVNKKRSIRSFTKQFSFPDQGELLKKDVQKMKKGIPLRNTTGRPPIFPPECFE